MGVSVAGSAGGVSTGSGVPGSGGLSVEVSTGGVEVSALLELSDVVLPVVPPWLEVDEEDLEDDFVFLVVAGLVVCLTGVVVAVVVTGAEVSVVTAGAGVVVGAVAAACSVSGDEAEVWVAAGATAGATFVP